MNPLLKMMAFITLLCSLVPCAVAQTYSQAPARIAVLYFEHTGGDSNTLGPLSKGLCSMMIADLKSQSGYNLVERDRIQEVLTELDMTRGVKFDQSAVAAIGKLVGAEYLVFGSFFEVMNKFNISARVVKVETGIIVAAATSGGKVEDFDTIQQAVTGDLLRRFEDSIKQSDGGAVPDRSTRGTPLANRTTLDGAVGYARALDDFDRGRTNSARLILMDIVESNPDFAVAKGMLVALSDKN